MTSPTRSHLGAAAGDTARGQLVTGALDGRGTPAIGVDGVVIRADIDTAGIHNQGVSRRPRHGIPCQQPSRFIKDDIGRRGRYLRHRYRRRYRPTTRAIGVAGGHLVGISASGRTGHADRGRRDAAGDRRPCPTVEALLHGVAGGADRRCPAHGERCKRQARGSGDIR